MDTTPRLRTLLLIPLLLAAAACGDDPAAPGGDDTLTEAEAEGLVEAVLSLGTDPELGGAVAAPARVPVTVGFPVDETVDCPLGGTLALDGEVSIVFDDETRAGSYDHELVKTHAACRVRAERTGQVFVLDGAPSVTSTLSADIQAEELLDLSGSEVGAVAWQLEDRSGTCAIDLEYSVTGVAQTSFSYQAAGTVCGRQVDIRIDIDGGS